MDIKDKKKFLFIAIIAAVAVIILVRTTGNIQRAIFKKKPGLSGKVPAMAFEEEIPSVKAFMVKRMDFKDTLPSIGNIKGFKEIDLRFQSQGIVESINFEEGEKIQEGDIIANLVQKDALLKLKYAEVEWTKNKRLFEIGVITPLKLDQAKLEYESAKSDLDKTNIYAMFDGFMGAKILDVGSYVNPSSNDRVGTFIVVNKVYAEFSIIEKDMPNVVLGQKVDIFSDTYPNRSFSGTVDRISPTIEGRSRTMAIKVELDNKDGILKPGLFVRALIYTYDKKDAIVVPTSAMRKKEADVFVYVVTKEEPKKEVIEEKPKEKKSGFFGFGAKKKEEPTKKLAAKEREAQFGVVETRKIKMGHVTADLMEIDDGVKEGDLVVMEVQEELKDKARVEISEVQEGVI